MDNVENGSIHWSSGTAQQRTVCTKEKQKQKDAPQTKATLPARTTEGMGRRGRGGPPIY